MSIIFLKGPDRVRKRPQIIFDSDGLDGAVKAVKLLLDIFITEAVLGFSKGIDVTIHKDNSVSIKSYDRGFAFDETIVEGKPAWYYVFCDLSCGPREPDDDFYYHLGCKHNGLYDKSESSISQYKTNVDHGFDLCCVQYASSYMHIKATKDGIKKSLDFEKGYSVSALQKENSAEKNNTFIHFLLDTDVFSDIAVKTSDICRFLKETAITIPGLKISFSDERNAFESTYFYPNGAQDYVSALTNNAPTVFVNEITATGKDRYNKSEYEAKVRIHVAFTDNCGETLCFHNYRKLEKGGCHLDAIKERLMNFINWEFTQDLGDDTYGKSDLSFSDICENVVLIIESSCPEYATNYINAKRNSINNRMITDMSHDLLNQDFEYYLRQNHNGILSAIKNNLG